MSLDIWRELTFTEHVCWWSTINILSIYERVCFSGAHTLLFAAGWDMATLMLLVVNVANRVYVFYSIKTVFLKCILYAYCILVRDMIIKIPVHEAVHMVTYSK